METERLRSLLAIAEAAVDDVESIFSTHVGAAPAVRKDTGDFATHADLLIERRLRDALSTLTDIPVLGEEFGCGDGRGTGDNANDADCPRGIPTEGPVWVIDPIDGTTNYAAGFPVCALLVALVVDGQPELSLTAMPLMHRRVTAIKGCGTKVNGYRVDLSSQAITTKSVAFGSIITGNAGTLPSTWRQEVLKHVGETYRTLRISGSVGVDLASTAVGAFRGAVTFSPHPWDNVAGVLLNRESGCVVTDIFGQPWQPDSVGVIAGTEPVHAKLLAAVQAAGNPEDFK